MLSLQSKSSPTMDPIQSPMTHSPQSAEARSPAQLVQHPAEDIFNNLDSKKALLTNSILKQETSVVLNLIHEINAQLTDTDTHHESSNQSDKKSDFLTEEEKRLKTEKFLKQFMHDENEQNKVVSDNFTPSNLFVSCLFLAYQHNNLKVVKAILDDKLCELTDSDVLMLFQVKQRNYKKQFLEILKAHWRFIPNGTFVFGYNAVQFFKTFLQGKIKALNDYTSSPFIQLDINFMANLNEALKISISMNDASLLKWCIQKTISVLLKHNEANHSQDNKVFARFNYVSLLEILITNNQFVLFEEVCNFILELESDKDKDKNKDNDNERKPNLASLFDLPTFMKFIELAIYHDKDEIFFNLVESLDIQYQAGSDQIKIIQSHFRHLVQVALYGGKMVVLRSLLDNVFFRSDEVLISGICSAMISSKFNDTNVKAFECFFSHSKIQGRWLVRSKSDPLLKGIHYLLTNKSDRLNDLINNKSVTSSILANKMPSAGHRSLIKVLLHFSVVSGRDEMIGDLISSYKNKKFAQTPSEMNEVPEDIFWLARLAAHFGKTSVFENLYLELSREDPKYIKNLSCSMLVENVSAGRFKLVEFLADQNAIKQFVPAPLLSCALGSAIASGHEGMARLLIKQGANPILEKNHPSVKLESNAELDGVKLLVKAFGGFKRAHASSMATVFKLVKEALDPKDINIDFVKSFSYFAILEKDLELFKAIESAFKNTEMDYITNHYADMIAIAIWKNSVEVFKYIYENYQNSTETNCGDSIAQLIELCLEDARLEIIKYLLKGDNLPDLQPAFESACLMGDVEIASYLMTRFQPDYKRVVRDVLPKVMLLGHIGTVELILNLNEEQVTLHPDVNDHSDFNALAIRVRGNAFMFALQNNLSIVLKSILQKGVNYPVDITNLLPYLLPHLLKSRYLKVVELIMNDERLDAYYSKNHLLGVAVQYNVISVVERLVSEANKEFDDLSPRVMSPSINQGKYADPAYDNNICFSVAIEREFYDVACHLLSNPKVMLTLDFDRQIELLETMKNRQKNHTIQTGPSQKKTLADVLVFLEQIKLEVIRIKQSTCFFSSEFPDKNSPSGSDEENVPDIDEDADIDLSPNLRPCF